MMTKNKDNAKKNENSVNETAKEEKAQFDREKERREGERRSKERRVKDRRAGHEEDPKIAGLKKELSEKDNEILKLNKEIESIKELIRRRQADFENFKKRSIKEREEYKKYAIKDFALEIININDDLLRAIEASRDIPEGESLEKAHNSFVEGVSMISKRIESTLQKYNIVEIEALSLEFDPNFHEAVEIEQSENVNKDIVTKVHRKGFRIDDLVVRSAKVKVTKPLKQDDNNGKTEQPGDEADTGSDDPENNTLN